MKKKLLQELIMLIALFPAALSAQTGIEKRLIATLGPGETLANGENCFLFDKDPETISFVTVTGSGSSKQYYGYGKDGKKTGPVKQPDMSYWAECSDIDAEDCVPNDEPEPVNMEEYIDFSTNTVKFQGKSYGPFGQMLMFHVSENGQNFYAVAVSNEMKIIFFDKNNRKTELAGMPDQILVSPDGSRAYAIMRGALNPFDPEAMQRIMSNPEEYQNPKINLAGIDGSNYGPYAPDSYSDAWFISSGKLVIYAGSEVSLDGKVIFRSEDHISKCDIWVSNNGKDYAWADYEHLIFNDGSKFTAPLAIKYTETGGKGFLKWIALEGGKDLMFYSRIF
ncbi:MAG: hypothetical protein MUC31_04480 [Bacteroidales bacterium]|nr:hypothetical protein [Bacteroidales bacterium]